MDAETVGLAAAVASTTIAGLGLVIAWQRDRKKQDSRLFAAAAGTIAVLGMAGVASVLILGRTESQTEFSGSSEKQPVKALTKVEYRQKAGAACTEGRDAAERLRRLEPRRPVGSLSVKFEESAVRLLKQLRPPRAFEQVHREAVALWTRRTTLLVAAFREPTQLTHRELRSQLSETDRLAGGLERIFNRLGVPECVI